VDDTLEPESAADSSAALLTPPAGTPSLATKKAAAAGDPKAKKGATVKKEKAKAVPPPEEQEEEEEDLSTGFKIRRWLRNSAAMFISAAVHLVLVIGLSFLVVDKKIIQEMHEVIAQALEEPEQKEMQVIELEKQLTEVTEQTSQVFSSSPIVGEVGASGPQGMVSAPTMDKALYEQVVNADVNIEGIFIDTPSSKSLIVEAPDGMIGDARAVVDSYEEALDQLTQEILWMLNKGKVLVVWNFDQSESMKNDQKEIRERIEHVYKELGLLKRGQDDSLETAITSYGAEWMNHTRKPSHDMTEIRQAIAEVPNDPTGKEMMCTAIGRSITVFQPYCQRTDRQMALIVLTDESGDRIDNDTQLERALAVAKAARCKLYVLGREAVFGYPFAHVRWIQPVTGHEHWIPIDRGPETAFAEQLQTDGFHRRYDAHPSGFGPYECSRLGRETGGIFFMLPSLETDLVRGEKRKYALEAMRRYLPDLRSRLEVKQEIDQSLLRTMLEKVVYDLNPYDPEISKIIEMRVRFSPDYPSFKQQAIIEQAKAIIYLEYLARVEKTIAKMEKQRREEASPRWQANYDLIYAQTIAYQARMYEYGAYLEEFIRNPKKVPLTIAANPMTKAPQLNLAAWDITTRQKTITGDKIKHHVERATAMFHAVMETHAGTPWAARAEYELKRGYGVELIEIYHGPPPVIPPGTPIPPVPKL
jgi:hypothetical protein